MSNKYEIALDHVARYCSDMRTMGKARQELTNELDMLKKLVDKETPKQLKIRYVDTIYETTESWPYCPICECDIYEDDQKYCHECGQKLKKLGK